MEPIDYFFLFERGNETDMALAELIAVLADPKIQFLSWAEFRQARETACPAICSLTNSCLVRALGELDLEQITRTCAYVHSCGPLVLCQEWAEKSVEGIASALKTYASGREFKLYFLTRGQGEAFRYDANVEPNQIDEEKFFVTKTSFKAAARLLTANPGQAPGRC